MRIACAHCVLRVILNISSNSLSLLVLPFPLHSCRSNMTVTKRPFLFRKSLPPAAGMRMGMSDRSQNLRCRAGLWVRDDIMFGGSCITFQPSRLFPFQPIGFSLFSHSAFHSLSLSLVNHTKSVDSAPAGDEARGLGSGREASMSYPISMFYPVSGTLWTMHSKDRGKVPLVRTGAPAKQINPPPQSP